MAAPYGGAERVLFALAAREREQRAVAHAALVLHPRSLPRIVEEMGGGRARKKRSQQPAAARRRR